MSGGIRSDPGLAAAHGGVFSVGSPIVATLASVAAHAAVVAVFMFHETTSVELGEVIVVDLVISEDVSETAHPPSIDAAGAQAETADGTETHADEGAPAMGGETMAAFPAPAPPVTAAPQPAPPSVVRPETAAEAVPREGEGPVFLPPRRPQRMRSASPEPPEAAPAADPLPRDAVPIETRAGEASVSQPAETSGPHDRGDRAGLPAEPAATGNEPAEQAAVYGGPVKAAPREGNPRPPYPARAIRRGWQGRVVLDVEVLPTGAVGEITVERSSGYGILDRAALKAVRRWHFKPAKVAGHPVRARAQVPVVFKLTR